jgi:hypothetical protein
VIDMTAQQIFDSIPEDVMEDRREYCVGDLELAYGIDYDTAYALFNMIQAIFRN